MITAWRLAHIEALRMNPDPFYPSPRTNRWSTSATEVAYASASVALAAMELLAYWGRYGQLDGYYLFAIEFPGVVVEDVLAGLPELNIRDEGQTRAVGDAWARNTRSVVLKVPSIVVPLSENYVINPRHPDAGEALASVRSLGEFRYDQRIIELVGTAKARH